MQEHIDTAISISPDNANLFYLRGRWSYEVAGLSWLEKKAAAALYATPPEATFVEALEDFMRVESLCEAAWKANLLMVAKVGCAASVSQFGCDWSISPHSVPYQARRHTHSYELAPESAPVGCSHH